MSDRKENRTTNREDTEAPGARHDAPEEYANYQESEPDDARKGAAEARREADLQPGTPESHAREREAEEDKPDG